MNVTKVTKIGSTSAPVPNVAMSSQKQSTPQNGIYQKQFISNGSTYAANANSNYANINTFHQNGPPVARKIITQPPPPQLVSHHHHHHQQQQQYQNQYQQQHQQHQQQPALSVSKSSISNSSSLSSSSSHSASPNNVKFIGFHTEKIDEREKYLTAKYPNHQMALIKKRLKVEFWIDDKLKVLYNGNDSSNDDYEICPDDLVDSLLDFDSDSERKSYIIEKLQTAKQSKEQIIQFADELLVKLRML